MWRRKGQRWERAAWLSHLFVLRYVKADASIIRPLTSRGLFFIREHACDTVHTRVNVRETHGSSAPPWGRPRCQTTRWRDLQDDVNATVFLDHAFRNIRRNVSLRGATRRGNFILVVDQFFSFLSTEMRYYCFCDDSVDLFQKWYYGITCFLLFVRMYIRMYVSIMNVCVNIN